MSNCYHLQVLSVSAVTIEGTIIHKSGLITGGQSSGTARRFNDSDVQSESRHGARS